MEVSEMAQRQRGRRRLVRSALPVQEQRERRHDVRLAHPFPQRRQVHRPQQRDPDLFLHHLQDLQAFPGRVRQFNLVESLRPAPVQPVLLQRVPQVHRHAFLADRAPVVQVAPLPADLPPPGVVVFRHPLRRHLPDLLDGPGHLCLRRAPRNDACVEAPFVRDPSHAVHIAGLDRHPRQFSPAAAPSVQHEVLADRHPVVLFQFQPRQHHEIAQRLRVVARDLCDAPVGQPVALYRVV